MGSAAEYITFVNIQILKYKKKHDNIVIKYILLQLENDDLVTLNSSLRNIYLFFGTPD